MPIFNGGRIGSNNDPTTSLASGLWTGIEQCDAVRREIWTGLVPPIVTDGLVLHLDAGDSASYLGSGTTWTDLSGNENDGTINGATYDSANGGSLSFDGNNDYVQCAQSSTLDLNELTICAWVKFDSINNTQYPTITNKETSNLNRNWAISISNGGVFAFGRSVNSVDSAVFSNITPNLNQWYFVSATNDLAPTFKIYINGILNNTNSLSGTLSTAGTISWIGSYREIIYPMDGNISQVSIYNRALTQSEITQNFNALKGRYGL